MATALSKLEASIEAQRAKLEQLKVRKQKMEARERARQQGLERRQDTRRKILAGAMLLEMMAEDPATEKKVLARLAGFLTRAEDRKLFGLRSTEE